MKYFPIFLFFFLVAGVAHGSIWDNFFKPDFAHGPSFPDSQLYPLDVGLSNAYGHVGGFGDFDSDKYTDIFVVSEDRKTIDVLLWNHDSYKFSKLSGATIDITNGLNNTNFIIEYIVPGDYNFDGKLDLLVSVSTTTFIDYESNVTSQMSIYFGNYATFTEPKLISTPSVGGHVLVMDANNDLKLDLLGTNYNNDNTTSTSFWINDGSANFHLSNFPDSSIKLTIPNSNSFVDIDGDCLPDLFLTSISYSCNESECGYSKKFEIWLNKKTSYVKDKEIQVFIDSNNNSLSKSIEEMNFIGQITFADVDSSGTMDLIIPICYPYPSCSEKNAIYILYNQQLPLCKRVWDSSSSCRSSSALCEADPNYYLYPNISLFNFGQSDNVVIIDQVALGWPNKKFNINKEYNSLSIRTGDYNLDGYPDLLIPFTDNNGNSWMELWKSYECNIELCGIYATNNRLRTFLEVDQGVDALVNINFAYAATFVDFDEDGVLDILVFTDPSMYSPQNSTTLATHKTIQGIYNNFFNDAFFLKTMASNGVCPGWCPSGDKFPSPKPYGVNLPGAVFKYTVSELSGSQRVTQGVQLYQSGYLSLLTPYILFGLGRTNNYIEQLFMGVSIYSDKEDFVNYNMWICIIPNAQVVGFPYKPDQPSEWSLELFLRSSGLTLWIIVAVLSLLILLASLICILRWKEKREDRLLKQETAHLFSNN